MNETFLSNMLLPSFYSHQTLGIHLSYLKLADDVDDVDLKKCEVTNEIGLISLINNALGIFDINAKISKQLFENVSRK